MGYKEEDPDPEPDRDPELTFIISDPDPSDQIIQDPG